MREILSADEAREIMEPHLSKVGECIRVGWNQWEDLARTAPARMTSRTRANVVYDFTVEHAKKRFLPDGDRLRVSELHGFLLLTFDDRVAVRFKKLANDLSTCGIPTQQRLDYENQQLSLASVTTPTLVVAGYVLDPLEADIADVVITCSLGGRLMWALPVESAVAPATLLQPEGRPIPPPEVRSTLVEPREDHERKSQ